MLRTKLLLETANFHAGSPGALLEVIDRLAGAEVAREGLAIKFHPIAADTLALPDFGFYKVYKQVEIPAATWSAIIGAAAARVGDVWIECADLNCIDVLEQNFAQVAGLKLQASILENDEVFSRLAGLDLSRKSLMLNISGHELNAIAEFLARFRDLKPGCLMLQAGFQGYPTALKDTCFNKLAVLKAAFPGVPLAFADHVDGAAPFARRVPLIAAALGCAIVEKHICLSRENTVYDGSAALEVDEAAELARELALLPACFSDHFVVPEEASYLAKSIQKPVIKDGLREGQLVARSDLLFRRTGRSGLALAEVERLQSGFRVLARALEASSAINAADFVDAHIGAVVACRMKSTRLPNKALLPIRGMASVERCLENCLRLPHVRSVVLATSVHPDDAVLERHTLGGRVSFWRGDPEDVIRRYLGACDKLGIDVVVRVTADIPVISPEVTQLLLEEHFRSGADYTRARSETVGTAPQIFNVEALRRIIALSGGAPHSEYMNMYVESNPEHFKIHWVDLPETWLRPYRLTLDYEEDLKMFEGLYAELERRGQAADLRNVLAALDSRPDLSALNASKTLVYQTDQELIRKLREVTRFPAPQ